MRITSFLSILTATIGIHGAALPEPDGTLSARQATTSTDPKWTDHATFRSSLVNRHNTYRDQHRVPRVTWNTTLSGFAMKYLDKKGKGKNTCPDFAHSGGPYGENLAIGFSTPTQATIAWGDERKDYNFNKPGFSSATGHFTQLVWKNTRQIGCARKYCTSSNVIRGWYLACEYYPRGNIIGQFDTQVLRQKSKRDAEENLEDEIEDFAFDDEEDADYAAEIDAEGDAEVSTGEPLVFYGGL